MRRAIGTAAVALIVAIGFSHAGEWKELEAFHMAMAETFHPAEEGNLKPLREQASDLLAKARAWQASAVPASYDQKKTTKALADLVAKCEQVDAAVREKQNDAELTKRITAAHDAFHTIVGECGATEAEKH